MGLLAVVIPVLGPDHKFLPGLLHCIAAQDCPPDEVIISTETLPAPLGDCTSSLPVRVLHNPGGAIARALNLAIQSTTCEWIVRFDVRARPPTNYISRCLAALTDEVDVVGGRLCISPGNNSEVAAAIALAVSHPLGAGDARYRIGGQRGLVDTVPYPCFRRTLWQRLGGYTETLGANEDYEFNWRVRQSGGQILFDPSIQCGYIARESFQALARQYFRYGWWKMQMLVRHPRSVQWRQILPVAAPAFVLAAAGLTLIVPYLAFLGVGLLLAYLCLLIFFGAQLALRRQSPAVSVTFPLAIIVLHSAWSAGAWISLLTRWAWPAR